MYKRLDTSSWRYSGQKLTEESKISTPKSATEMWHKTVTYAEDLNEE